MSEVKPEPTDPRPFGKHLLYGLPCLAPDPIHNGDPIYYKGVLVGRYYFSEDPLRDFTRVVETRLMPADMAAAAKRCRRQQCDLLVERHQAAPLLASAARRLLPWLAPLFALTCAAAFVNQVLGVLEKAGLWPPP